MRYTLLLCSFFTTLTIINYLRRKSLHYHFHLVLIHQFSKSKTIKSRFFLLSHIYNKSFHYRNIILQLSSCSSSDPTKINLLIFFCVSFLTFGIAFNVTFSEIPIKCLHKFNQSPYKHGIYSPLIQRTVGLVYVHTTLLSLE